MKTVVFLFLFLVNSLAHSQSNDLNGLWLFNLQHNDIGAARTLIRFEADSTRFEAHTREQADRDLLGRWTALLGRAFTPHFKQGSLIRIVNGVSKMENDTLRLKAIFTSAMGNLHFNGYCINGVVHAELTNGKGELRGTMEGQKSSFTHPLEDYKALIEKASVITRENIYNQALLESRKWKKFTKKTGKVSPKIHDDLEMIFAHFYYAGKLPVSHYALLKLQENKEISEEDSTEQKSVFLEEVSKKTAYLKIKSFDGSAEEMDAVFDTILRNGYENLIVDMRNNSGGSISSGMTFATHVADTSFYGGIFLTQKWFNDHSNPPTLESYSEFPHFTEANYGLIIEGIHSTQGLCLKVIPEEQAYTGKLFILTNAITASTCEPIVYGLKHQNRAIIVGEKTAGAMLNGERFYVDNGFTIIVPTADYYTADGYRIDQNGVTPDRKVNEEDALEYVLKQLLE